MKPLTNKINKLDIAIQNNEAVIKKNAIRQSQQDGIFYEEKIMIHLLDNSNKFDTMPRMKETTTKPHSFFLDFSLLDYRKPFFKGQKYQSLFRLNFHYYNVKVFEEENLILQNKIVT